MRKLFYIKNKLKNNATSAERAFEIILLSIPLQYKFQKAFIIPGSEKIRVVDFYIPWYRLAFEIDGNYHNNSKQRFRDEEREREIHQRRKKLRIVRFTNQQVLNDAAWVRAEILKLIYPRN